MVGGDYFTKWVEAYAVPYQEVTTVAKELFHNFCCRYGAPMEIHTEQGENCESGVFKELCRLLGIRKTRTCLLYTSCRNVDTNNLKFLRFTVHVKLSI